MKNERGGWKISSHKTFQAANDYARGLCTRAGGDPGFDHLWGFAYKENFRFFIMVSEEFYQKLLTAGHIGVYQVRDDNAKSPICFLK